MLKKEEKKGAETPLMQQYNQFKSVHSDAILLFRVGDFYETFGLDAEKVSKILGIILTKRSNGAAKAVPLAGFPYHALDNYLPRLVREGYKVAICDQLEDAKKGKGLVKRGITEIVTPGLAYSDRLLEQKKNNYLASIFQQKEKYGIAMIDISTGNFKIADGGKDYIDHILASYQPSEIIYCKGIASLWPTNWLKKRLTTILDEWVYRFSYAQKLLQDLLSINNLKSFGMIKKREATIAAGSVLHYLKQNKYERWEHIKPPQLLVRHKFLWLDDFTIRNLELVKPQQHDGISLLSILDSTLTPMGGRLMRQILLTPSQELSVIQKQLSYVELFYKNYTLCELLRKKIAGIGDLERLTAKVVVRRISPREIYNLSEALQKIFPIVAKLESSSSQTLQQFSREFPSLQPIINRLKTTLVENPPLLVHQGGIVKSGVKKQLDEFREMLEDIGKTLEVMQQEEREKTKIHSLKLGKNRLFGYYWEVRNIHKEKVPTNWVRKQTLTNAERYISEKLKTYENKIYYAENNIQAIEEKIFNDLVEETAGWAASIQKNSQQLARLDLYLSHAHTAVTYRYCKPKITEKYNLQVKEGRHPVIERCLPFGKNYVPNSFYMEKNNKQIGIVTGPNMGGKSALLRQLALMVIMAQSGSFVPADYMEIGYVDKLFIRAGASDNLALGESTFMLEMMETANILNNVTERSLIVIDELGRGTSYKEGMAISRAVIEYLYDHPMHPKTLISTHYHLLSQMENSLQRLHSYHMEVKTEGSNIIFCHNVKPGGALNSFGVQVATLAGLPAKVIEKAKQLLSHSTPDLENKSKNKLPTKQKIIKKAQIASWIKQLQEISLDTITPIDSLSFLQKLQKQANREIKDKNR